MEPREALARALHAYAWRGSNQTWNHVSPARREMWLNQADFVLRHLREAGFTIARAGQGGDQ